MPEENVFDIRLTLVCCCVNKSDFGFASKGKKIMREGQQFKLKKACEFRFSFRSFPFQVNRKASMTLPVEWNMNISHGIYCARHTLINSSCFDWLFFIFVFFSILNSSTNRRNIYHSNTFCIIVQIHFIFEKTILPFSLNLLLIRHLFQFSFYTFQ